jgi:hypothetical protein
MGTQRRPRLNPKTVIAVWAAAAGRCTFCNQLVIENEELGLAVPIGELAHNVGWSKGSPRGKSSLSSADRSDPDNLILLCRNCHKPIDDQGVIGLYPIHVLRQFKQEHEARIRFLTGIGADRKAHIIRLVGPICGVSPELTYETVLTALTAAGIFPATLPNGYRNAIEIDLREYGEGTAETFATCTQPINEFVARINDGIKRDQISRIAVFAFARIPLLVYLGSKIDDKVPMLIFQRQRTDDQNAWRWPTQPPAPAQFSFKKQQTREPDRVALVLNISGTIHLRELPEDIQQAYTVYELVPVPPDVSDPSVISSLEARASFERTLRSFLAHIEKEHGKIPEIAVFPAIPISCAITLGRVLMPHVSPSLILFDRNERNNFYRALEVKR